MLENVIHAGAEATLTWLTTKDPGLKQIIDKSYGYAVFPAVGRASAVLAVGRGYGEVFEHGKPIGFATLTQMTLGVQVGGQTFSELVVFGNKDALESFKKGKVSFTANASAVLAKAAATGTSDFRGVVAKAYSRGGMLLEASIGGQKFKFHEHLDKSKKGERRREAKARIGTTKEDEALGANEAASSGAKGVEAAPDEGAEDIEAKGAREVATEGASESARELEPEEGIEAATVGTEYEPKGEGAEGAEPATDERIEAAVEGDEGDDAVPSAEAAEPARAVSTVTRAVERSRPQGHNGLAEAGVGKAIKGMRGRIAGTGRKVVGKVAHFISKRGRPHALDRAKLALAKKRHPVLLGKPIDLVDKLRAAATALEKEAAFGPVLSGEVDAALRRMTERDPGLKEILGKAHGYAVFPLVGKATAALGVGFGRGEVFERGRLIGYAGIVQLTLGLQVGGQTYDELIIFENESALERFKSGNLAFAMNASAVLVKAGAAATTNYASGTAVFVHPEGGLMLELALGGQKFIYRRKVLGAPGVTLGEPGEAGEAKKEITKTAARTEELGKAGRAVVARTAARAKELGEAGGAAVGTTAEHTKEVGKAGRSEVAKAAVAPTTRIGAAGRAVRRGLGALMAKPRALIGKSRAEGPAAQKKGGDEGAHAGAREAGDESQR